MIKVCVLAAAIGLVGCDGAALGSSLRQKIADPNGTKATEQEQRAAELNAANAQRVEAARAQQQQRLADEQTARDKKAADAEQKVADTRAARAAELEQECGASRAERLSYLKATIREYHAEMKELAPHIDWIEKHCRYEDTRGVLVQRERTKDGVIVRTKQVGEEEEPKCDAAKPRGVTQERVKRVLWINTREESDPLGTNYATNRDQFSVVNSRCAPADRAAGVDLFVTMTDFEAQKAILVK